MTEIKEFNLSNEAHIVDGIFSAFTFQFRNEAKFEEIKKGLNERYYPEDKVKEFIRELKNYIKMREREVTKGIINRGVSEKLLDFIDNLAGEELSK